MKLIKVRLCHCQTIRIEVTHDDVFGEEQESQDLKERANKMIKEMAVSSLS